MSYEHCERHDQDATNGCPGCEAETRERLLRAGECTREKCIACAGPECACWCHLSPLFSDAQVRALQRRSRFSVKAPDELTLTAVAAEVMRARIKFPGNRFLLAALTEEVGELARALLQKKPKDELERECLQVAALAVRLCEEGDAAFADITDAEAKS